MAPKPDPMGQDLYYFALRRYRLEAQGAGLRAQGLFVIQRSALKDLSMCHTPYALCLMPFVDIVF
jgi:hypothetical protein